MCLNGAGDNEYSLGCSSTVWVTGASCNSNAGTFADVSGSDSSAPASAPASGVSVACSPVCCEAWVVMVSASTESGSSGYTKASACTGTGRSPEFIL